jgi:peptidoglycan/LPS O-acetylase OafA/YrhL
LLQIFSRLANRRAFQGLWRRLLGVLVALWVFGYLLDRGDCLNRAYHELCGNRLLIGGKDPVGYLLNVFRANVHEYLLFPATLVILPLIEVYREGFGRQLAFLGDISYSAYLLHFPLLLGILLLIPALGIAPPALLSSPPVFLGYIATVMVLAFLCHRYFEMPVQQWLRARYSGNISADRRSRRAASLRD